MLLEVTLRHAGKESVSDLKNQQQDNVNYNKGKNGRKDSLQKKLNVSTEKPKARG